MTDNRIHKLSPLLINQIAAGEVVTRPASVVKELIENAIDAHATHIRIDIEQGGLGLIQISDNGSGIHPDDMTLAVTRHATSKLADVGELSGVDSLGFRGEALASIAAVAHLTLASSHSDTGIGQQLSLSANAISEVSQVSIKPIVKNRGTTVTVRDLYYNVPARRSNLKSIATEFAHIEQVVQRLAICFADIQMDLYHQDKLRFSLSKTTQNDDKNHTLNRLEQALNLPLNHIADLFFLSLQGLQGLEQDTNNSAKVTGWLFVDDKLVLPKLIYINQRLVSDLAISQAMQKAARQLGFGNDNNLQLGYALFFDLPNEWINVNIHPSKQQVKIQPLTNILAWLNQKVYEQLQTKVAEFKAENLLKKAAKDDLIADDLNEKNDNELEELSVNDLNTNNLNGDNQYFDLPNHVAENQLSYHYVNQTITQAVCKPLISADCPNVITLCEHNQKTVAIVFWQTNFYLLDLASLAIPNDKFGLQSMLNVTSETQIFDQAIRITQTELIQWILSTAK